MQRDVTRLELMEIAKSQISNLKSQNSKMERATAYRTVTPDLFVYILAAMFIEASSWKSNFAA